MKVYREWRCAAIPMAAQLCPRSRARWSTPAAERQCMRGLDPDGDGVMEGGAHTYDIEFTSEPCRQPVPGAPRACGSLRALARFPPRYRTRYERAARGWPSWECEYYSISSLRRQIVEVVTAHSRVTHRVVPGENGCHQYGRGCLIDQLWSRGLACVSGWTTCCHLSACGRLASIFATTARRPAITPTPPLRTNDDSGLLRCICPLGERRPTLPYSDEVGPASNTSRRP